MKTLLTLIVLLVTVAGSNAAFKPLNQVSLGLGNCTSDSVNQAKSLATAIQKNPKVTRFLMTWQWEVFSTSAAGAVVYNRKAHMLRFRTLGGFSARSTAPGSSPMKNYLYTQVTDATLLQLAKVGGGASLSGSFEKLPAYGCARHKIKQACWF